MENTIYSSKLVAPNLYYSSELDDGVTKPYIIYGSEFIQFKGSELQLVDQNLYTVHRSEPVDPNLYTVHSSELVDPNLYTVHSSELVDPNLHTSIV